MSRTLLILTEFALLIALGWYCIRVESSDVEADLAHRSTAVLGYSGLEAVTPLADGQTIILRGRVASPEQKRRAIDSVASLWGVTEVRDEMVVAPEAARGDAAADAATVTTTESEPAIADSALAQQCRRDLQAVTEHAKPRFELGSDTLTSDSAALLRQIGAVLRRCPGLTLKITGHTDSIGNAEDNLRLSEARARRVAEALHEMGIERTRLRAEGAGETRPIADNASPAGREANRRIEFEFVPATQGENDHHASTP